MKIKFVAYRVIFTSHETPQMCFRKARRKYLAANWSRTKSLPEQHRDKSKSGFRVNDFNYQIERCV